MNEEEDVYKPCLHQDRCLNYPCHDFNTYSAILDKLSIDLSPSHFTQCDNIENDRCHLSNDHLLRSIHDIESKLYSRSQNGRSDHQIQHIENITMHHHQHHFHNSVTWDDVVFYLPVAKNMFRMNIQYYWLDIFLGYIPDNVATSPFIINYILITEEDSRMTLELLKPYFKKYESFLNMSMVRVPRRVHDDYNQLVCKMTAGMKLIYQLFPYKMYYIKIDDDTLLFPNRLLKLLRTTNFFYRINEVPIYLGKSLNYVFLHMAHKVVVFDVV